MKDSCRGLRVLQTTRWSKWVKDMASLEHSSSMHDWYSPLILLTLPPPPPLPTNAMATVYSGYWSLTGSSVMFFRHCLILEHCSSSSRSFSRSSAFLFLSLVRWRAISTELPCLLLPLMRIRVEEEGEGEEGQGRGTDSVVYYATPRTFTS